MRPRKQERSASDDLFRTSLDNMLDHRHELFRLARLIEWDVFDEAFGRLYRDRGRPAKPTRLMVGLSYLKHAFDLSDGEVVARWVENPYWQWFCGFEYFQHAPPIEPSSLTRWRRRIGADGMETLLAETVRCGLVSGAVKAASLERVTVDTTVQPKAIAHPTDARLCLRALNLLVGEAKRHGVKLRQSHTRLAKKAALKAGRYAHARQMKRCHREMRRLKTYLGRVSRDVARKTAREPELERRFAGLLSLVERLLAQQRHDKNKLYSLHAPEVVCIAKGNARTRYEFGAKVALATTNREGFVLASKAFPGNPYDGHTLARTNAQIVRVTGVEPKRFYADRGYRGHDYDKPERVFLSGRRRGLTPTMKRELKRRSAIEATIGHMKTDGRLSRNYLLGHAGDAINALLCAAGHNLRLILNHLRALVVLILAALFGAQTPDPADPRTVQA